MLLWCLYSLLLDISNKGMSRSNKRWLLSIHFLSWCSVILNFWSSSSKGHCWTKFWKLTVFTIVASAFTAVAAKNTDETAVTNTAATSVKFNSHRSKMSFSILCALSLYLHCVSRCYFDCFGYNKYKLDSLYLLFFCRFRLNLRCLLESAKAFT